MIKKNRLRIIASAMLVAALIASAAFGGTFAWFVSQTELDEKIPGEMGTVSVTLKDGAIKNESNIPIILRVKVIAEWVGDDDTMGIPPSEIEWWHKYHGIFGNLGRDWKIFESADLEYGYFLVYVGGENFEDANGELVAPYGIIPPSLESIKLPSVKKQIPTISNWTLEITYIVEALQATQKAYEYTVDNAADPGVTSWKLKEAEVKHK